MEEKSGNIKIWYVTAAKIIYIIAAAAAVAAVAFTWSLNILPSEYMMLLIVAAAILCGAGLFLLLFRKKVKTMRIICIVLSAVIIAASVFILFYAGSVKLMVDAISDDSVQNETEAVADLEEYSSRIDEETLETGVTGEAETDVEAEQVEVMSESFILYISGMDESGSGSSIKDKGRSDVNMIAAVNPETKTIMLITCPRDSYVALNGDEDKMEKLTHCGLYGVDVSMTSFRWLFDYRFDFNYYAKVSFESLKRLVDAVGGIDVYSDYSFTGVAGGYHFSKGENHLNGEQALCFARERYNLSDGDMQRGRDQQKVIQGLLDKLSSSEVLNPSTFSDVMEIISDNVQTNMTSEEVSALLQKTMEGPWDLKKYDITGEGSKKKCYTGGKVRWVFLPYQESVDLALDKINAAVAGEEIPEETAEETE